MEGSEQNIPTVSQESQHPFPGRDYRASSSEQTCVPPAAACVPAAAEKQRLFPARDKDESEKDYKTRLVQHFNEKTSETFSIDLTPPPSPIRDNPKTFAALGIGMIAAAFFGFPAFSPFMPPRRRWSFSGNPRKRRSLKRNGATPRTTFSCTPHSEFPSWSGSASRTAPTSTRSTSRTRITLDARAATNWRQEGLSCRLPLHETRRQVEKPRSCWRPRTDMSAWSEISFPGGQP